MSDMAAICSAMSWAGPRTVIPSPALASRPVCRASTRTVTCTAPPRISRSTRDRVGGADQGQRADHLDPAYPGKGPQPVQVGGERRLAWTAHVRDHGELPGCDR